MAGPQIVLEALTRRYGRQTAVDAVDLAVAPGEIYGFLGPNGAGKTTVVRVLCTLLLPSGGTARVAGYDVVTHRKEVRLRIGVALQDVALDPQQTGRELLALQGRLYGMRGRQVARRIEELGLLVDLDGALDRRIGTFSGGMQRRLDLAAALVHGPEVLFLDEPTAGLDPAARLRVWEEIRRMSIAGVTVFLTTQDLEEAEVLAGRVGIIHRGRMVAEGAPADLRRSLGADVVTVKVDDGGRARLALEAMEGLSAVGGEGDEVRFSTDDGASLVGPISVHLDRHGVTVREVSVRTPTLGDVFLRATGARIESEGGA